MDRNYEQIVLPTEEHTGALATPDLVGREHLVAEIEAAIRDVSSASVFYITGAGGIGKTRLASHFLVHYPAAVPKPVRAGLVDLYDISTNTIEGFIKRIQERLSPDKTDTAFDTYLAEYHKLDWLKITAGNTKVLEQQRDKMVNAFFADLNRLTGRYRLVLVLDTAEKLFHRENPVVAKLGLTEERPELLSWLASDFFPRLPNLVVLLAGRPEAQEAAGQSLQETLRETFAALRQIDYRAVALQGLTETEALAYFEAVVRRTESTGDPGDAEVARFVRSLTEEERRKIFHCLRDEGNPPHIRPILLALAIDHLVTAGRPLEDLTKLTLAQAQTLTKDQRKEIRQNLGRTLVRTLRESARPADRVLITLSILRLGADARLLSNILAGEAPETIARAIEEIRHLSFVKQRGDGRLILHDEMYGLLQPDDEIYDYEPERDRILAAMEEFYKARIAHIRQEISRLTAPLVEIDVEYLDKTGQTVLAQIIQVRGDLQTAILEDLHYRLRRDARQGFQVFYRYVEEAVVEGDIVLGAQLQAEVYGFLSERDPSGQQPEVDGLRRADVDADAAVRQIEWLWADNRLEEALKLAEYLGSQQSDLIEAGGDLPVAELSSWHGYLEGYPANYRRAAKFLKEAIDKLAESAAHTIRSAGILAQAYNQLGYVYRLQGRTNEAIQSYKMALPYWRIAGFKSMQAATLNNLAFALGLTGDFEAADRYGRDALSLRLESGPTFPLGLSLSTLAMIDIRHHNLDRGQRWAQRAYTLFSFLDNKRNIGLALNAWAEAKRRISGTITYRQRGQTAQLLAEAAEHASEAAYIFTSLIPEPDHQVRALVEIGCAYRDWALLRQADQKMQARDEEVTGQIQSVEELANRSRQTFQKALEAAKDVYDLRADALLNMALLHYFTAFELKLADPDDTLALLNNQIFPQIEQAVLGHYSGQGIELNRPTDLFKHHKGELFAVFLGRLELIRAQVALARFNQAGREDAEVLREMARHFTLALAYLGLYSDKDFREMRIARQRAYDALNKLNAQELNLFFEAVAEVERRHDLEQSPMSSFLEDNFGLTQTIQLVDE